jgi:hypothetical protein
MTDGVRKQNSEGVHCCEGGRVRERGAEAAAPPGFSQIVRDHLGSTLRVVFGQELERHPIPAWQADLLLALRHKERERVRRR